MVVTTGRSPLALIEIRKLLNILQYQERAPKSRIICPIPVIPSLKEVVS